MGGNERQIPDLDKVIHERARLRILVFLASSAESETGFTDLKSGLGMTAGNLSAQLSTLEEAGYIALRKTFIGKKPFTGVSLTLSGDKALEQYLDEMESMLAAARGRR
ncbi:MAG: transcriptional regulator [Spirochaetes bacterium]|nr:transcriptional regulator [Spirochaetota bacterium]